MTSTMALGFVSSVLYLRGDRRETIAAVERGLTVVEAHGFAFRAIDFAMLLPATRDERPDLATLDSLAREWEVQGLTRTWRRVLSACILATLYGEIGAPERGLEVLARVGDPETAGFYGSEIYRVQGELGRLLSPGAFDDAVRCFQQAIDLARRQELKSMELRAATSLARVWRDQGRRDDARRALADVYGWFTEGFDTQDLRAAKALLDDLAS
jgi:tetratricopeptide (TPR) repeat protein